MIIEERYFMFKIQNLAAAYAVDALTGSDLIFFEQALKMSPSLQESVSSFSSTVEGLASLVPALPPSLSLKEKIMLLVA